MSLLGGRDHRTVHITHPHGIINQCIRGHEYRIPDSVLLINHNHRRVPVQLCSSRLVPVPQLAREGYGIVHRIQQLNIAKQMSITGIPVIVKAIAPQLVILRKSVRVKKNFSEDLSYQPAPDDM